jgi:hypothetical protein
MGAGRLVTVGTIDKGGKNQFDGCPAFALTGGTVTAFL